MPRVNGWPLLVAISLPAHGPFQVHAKIIDVVDTVRHSASLTREYALKKNVTRINTPLPRRDGAKGTLVHTIQPFPRSYVWPQREPLAGERDAEPHGQVRRHGIDDTLENKLDRT
jgi:hypothetical protein